MKILLYISYNGSKFQGFQQQNHTKNTVMNKILDTFKTLGIHDTPVGSGRTDSGVHASNQTLHVELPEFWEDLQSLKVMLNRHLNPYIFIKKIKPVKDYFHARFSPIKREYRYILSHDKPNPFEADLYTFYPNCDAEKLNEILGVFKGEHDFEFFKKNGSDTKNFIREIYKIKAHNFKNKTIITIQANGFLRSQIRMMISAVLKVYEGKITLNELQNQLDKKHIYSQTLAQPNGLYLHRIFYKSDVYL